MMLIIKNIRPSISLNIVKDILKGQGIMGVYCVDDIFIDKKTNKYDACVYLDECNKKFFKQGLIEKILDKNGDDYIFNFMHNGIINTWYCSQYNGDIQLLNWEIKKPELIRSTCAY